MRKNKKTSLLSKFLLLINSFAVISLLISYAAKLVDPITFWPVAFFGLGYPIILLVNIIFVAYWLIRKRWFALISIITILFGYNSLTSTFAFRFNSDEQLQADSSSIKLMSYNVHHFKKFGSSLDSGSKSSILNLIDREQPDILGLQEFFTRHKGKYDVKDSIFRILNTKNYHYNVMIDNQYESIGIAVFSKYPILRKGNINLPNSHGGNNGVWIEVKKDNQIFRVYVVHLASISFQPEDYNYLIKLKSELKTDEDFVSSKRIARRLKDAFIRRSNQVKSLKELTDTCKVPYIIMGDFNDTPVSYTLNELNKGMKNGFREKGSGLGITYNGIFPNFQIDYILSSPHFEFNKYHIIKEAYSDHYPLTCNVTLKD